MKSILEAPFLKEMVRTISAMYSQGWDERNGGNVSLILDEDQIAGYLDLNSVIRSIPTGFTAPGMDGRYFLITATGSFSATFSTTLKRTWALYALRTEAGLRSCCGALPEAESSPASSRPTYSATRRVFRWIRKAA